MPKKGEKTTTTLSDEEQLLLFQHKMLAEEEMAKKKERLLSQFLKVMAFYITPCPSPPTPCRLDPVFVAASFSCSSPLLWKSWDPNIPRFGATLFVRRGSSVWSMGGAVIERLAVTTEPQNWHSRCYQLSQFEILIFTLEMGHYKQHPALDASTLEEIHPRPP